MYDICFMNLVESRSGLDEMCAKASSIKLNLFLQIIQYYLLKTQD